MKKIIYGVMILFLTVMFLFPGEAIDIEKEKTAIKNVILSAYCDGIGNVGDVEAIKKGFYKDFKLYGLNKDKKEMWMYPIQKWMASVAKKKAEGKYPPKEKITFKFPMIDVVGHAAMAKIKFYKGEKLAYSDFLSLYKFNDGWKIVAKIYFEHKDPKAKK
jgi:Putative lumazine-binding